MYCFSCFCFLFFCFVGVLWIFENHGEFQGLGYGRFHFVALFISLFL